MNPDSNKDDRSEEGHSGTLSKLTEALLPKSINVATQEQKEFYLKKEQGEKEAADPSFEQPAPAKDNRLYWEHPISDYVRRESDGRRGPAKRSSMTL